MDDSQYLERVGIIGGGGTSGFFRVDPEQFPTNTIKRPMEVWTAENNDMVAIVKKLEDASTSENHNTWTFLKHAWDLALEPEAKRQFSIQAWQKADATQWRFMEGCRAWSKLAATRILSVLKKFQDNKFGTERKTPQELIDAITEYDNDEHTKALPCRLNSVEAALASMDLQRYDEVILHAVPLENEEIVLVAELRQGEKSAFELLPGQLHKMPNGLPEWLSKPHEHFKAIAQEMLEVKNRPGGKLPPVLIFPHCSSSPELEAAAYKQALEYYLGSENAKALKFAGIHDPELFTNEEKFKEFLSEHDIEYGEKFVWLGTGGAQLRLLRRFYPDLVYYLDPATRRMVVEVGQPGILLEYCQQHVCVVGTTSATSHLASGGGAVVEEWDTLQNGFLGMDKDVVRSLLAAVEYDRVHPDKLKDIESNRTPSGESDKIARAREHFPLMAQVLEFFSQCQFSTHGATLSVVNPNEISTHTVRARIQRELIGNARQRLVDPDLASPFLVVVPTANSVRVEELPGGALRLRVLGDVNNHDDPVLLFDCTKMEVEGPSGLVPIDRPVIDAIKINGQNIFHSKNGNDWLDFGNIVVHQHNKQLGGKGAKASERDHLKNFCYAVWPGEDIVFTRNEDGNVLMMSAQEYENYEAQQLQAQSCQGQR